jgi:hypothetical protein
VQVQIGLPWNKLTPAARLGRARSLRGALPKGKFSAPEIDMMKKRGS